jgi:hypothetical protein
VPDSDILETKRLIAERRTEAMKKVRIMRAAVPSVGSNIKTIPLETLGSW